MIASLIVKIYRFWHGKLHQKGAGLILRSFRTFLPGLHSYQLQLSDGHAITIDFRDVSAFYWLNYTLGDRFEEQGLLIALTSMCRKGSIIWDVGGNCGLFSYCLAKQCEGIQVIFFEPNPLMFALARDSTSHYKNVQGCRYALSDAAGDALLTIPAGSSTTGTLNTITANLGVVTMKTECRTGDELVRLNELQIPDIIKIDTEGHEVSVIHGLKNIISKHKPVIFFEHINLSDSEVFSLLPDDYSIWAVCDVSGKMSKGFTRSKGHNSALLPNES